MAMSTAANMLRRYNQKDEKEIIGQQADGTKRGLASWSYTNPYDALYDTYKNDKNFNTQLWHDAVSRGEQDNYLAFLEKNKGTDMSTEFYDPEYYDYESMMLELYLPFANKENTDEMRTHNVFDQVNHKWVEEDIGKMSDYDYLQYQIKEARALKNAQIQRQLDQDHKEEQGFLKNLWTHTAATGMEVGEGIVSALAGLGDLFGALGYASARNIGDAIRGENTDDVWSWGDYFVEYYGKGLLASEKEVLRAQLDEYERTHTYFRDVDGNITGWGTYIAGVANSIGMMIPAIVTNALTAGTAGTAMSAVQGAVGTGTFYASIFSHNMYENATDESLVDTPAWNKILNAGTKTAVEAVIEHGLTWALGGTIQNKMLGIKGRTAKELTEITAMTGARYVVKSALQEGLEEFIQDFSTSLVDTFMGMWHDGYAKRADGVNIQTLTDAFFAGVLSSLVMSGTSIGINGTRDLLVNRKARKDPAYAGYEVLPGDMAIEKTVKTPKLDQDGKTIKDKDGNVVYEDKVELVRLHGWNKLYLKSVFSDLKDAIDGLRNGDIKHAQETYAAVNALAQYYAGFDQTRLKNCEELLNRVMNEDEFADFAEIYENSAAAEALSSETIAAMEKSANYKKNVEKLKKEKTQTLADSLTNEFVVMTQGVGLRAAMREQVRAALDEKKEELKENKVHQVKGVKQKKREKQDAEINEALQSLSAPAQQTLEELAKNYDFITVTDGHYALDIGEIAFVSESWLENYSTDEIYEFMCQTKLIDTIKSTKEYQPMLTNLLKFVREFTGKQEVSLSHAIFEFLFNSNIYQGFLLSNNGARVHEYKKFIFKIQEFVYQVAHDSPYVQQKFGKSQMPSQKRINLVHKLYDRIRNAWRIPTLKAILNWGFDPVEVGAYMSGKSGGSAILTEDDMKLVNEWQTRKERLAEPLTGNITQAHVNLAEDIIAEDIFTDEEIAMIRRGREKNATNDEKLISRMFLELGDSAHYESDVRSQIVFLPPAALSSSQDMVSAQWIADKLNEFEHRYGISAEQMILSQSSLTDGFNANILKEDMHILGIGSVAKFVQKKLENMLGSEYVVVTSYDLNRGSPIRIAKKISAEEILPSGLKSAYDERHSLFWGAIEELNEIETRERVSYWYEYFADMYGRDKTKDFGNAEDLFELIKNKVYFWPDIEFAMSGPENRFTGELYEDDVRALYIDFWKSIITELKNEDDIYLLSSFIRTDIFSDELRDFCNTTKIKIISPFNLSAPVDGEYLPDINTIVISEMASDPVTTLVHEFNHLVQHFYNLSPGAEPKMLRGNRDLISYVKKNYQVLINYVLRIDPTMNSDSAAAFVGYKMLEGELHASEGFHNTNIVGFKRVQKNGREYFLAPDGITEFESIFPAGKQMELKLQIAPSMTAAMTDAMAKVYFDDTMKLILARQEAGTFGYTDNDYTRNTFHTRARRVNPYEVLYGVTDPSLKLSIIAGGISIDDIIQNPKEFLSQEVLAILNGNYSEGNVYYRLKEYIEEHFDGASLDRDSRTHEVVIVDDNAFDDMLRVDRLADATDFDSASLFDRYHGKEGVPLSTFYNTKELRRLGIDPDIKVVIDPSLKTQAIRDKEHPLGEIHIGVRENTANATVIDRLNHEFRHLLQLYNNLETGFTPDFEATPELIADIKAHVPQLFTDRELRSWMKQVAKNSGRTVDEVTAQWFVYLHSSGELNANGWANLKLGTKPVYATYQAGKPTIFLPWYNAKTGEGKHTTKYLAMLADDLNVKDAYKGLKGLLPPVEKKQKTFKVGNVELPLEEKAKDTRSRHFSAKKARGTNLYYYIKAGIIDQLDPKMQDFVIATTGHLDKLPKELRHNIEHGLLTRNMLIGWFNKAARKDINEFTFNLMNKYIFKNDYIRTIEQLDDVLTVGPEFYYGLAIVLRKGHAPLESIIAQNDVDTFMTFINRIQSSSLYDKIVKESEKYYDVRLPNGHVSKGVEPSEKFLRSMRSRAMLNFNGSIAGAFKMSKSFKRALSIDKYMEELKVYSGDKTIQGKTGDIGTVFDAIASDQAVGQDSNARQVGNDIEAAYELMEEDKELFIDELSETAYRLELNAYIDRLNIKSKDLMKKTLATNNWRKEEDDLLWKVEHNIELTPAQQSKLRRFDFYDHHVRKLKKEVYKKLNSLSVAELKARAEIHRTAIEAGIPVDPALFDLENNFAHVLSPDEKRDADTEIQRRDVILNRERTVGRIKDSGKAIGRYIREGVITMDDLPNDLKELFELVKVKEPGTQRVIKEWRINQRLYTVGKGRKALPGNEDKTLKRYQKRNFNIAEDTNELYRHDISELISIDDKLFRFKKELSDKAREIAVAKKDTEKTIARLKRQNEQQRKKIDKLQSENDNLRTTDFRVNKKKEKLTRNPVSDTPNLFSIVSPIDMPEVLRDLYDTSFTDFADTRVQFVSKNEKGEYYDKETMKPKDFDSLVKHEKSNYDKFYQANLETLSKLTRKDVFDIIEFIEKGAITADGPMGKLQAFEIYLLGFFVEGARENLYGWNFSDAELKHVEGILENRASEAGMALRAVKDISKIIDPLKKFIEMQFANWETLDPEKTEAEDPEVVQKRRDKLIELIRAGKNNKENAEIAFTALNEAAKREAEARRKKNGLDKRWSKEWFKSFFSYNKIMSLRMWSMLSSPTTWIKNRVSNIAATGINALSDLMAKTALGKKAYRDDQANLSGVQVSEEVRQFIEQYVKNNKLFDELYDIGSKYDPRKNAKDRTAGESFTALIVAAWERQFAANYHMDGTQKSMFAKWVTKAMSDSSSVKRAALKYYGKLLTIDVNAGKIDLKNGFKSTAVNVFADAIVLAAHDYMHKRSAIAEAIDMFAGEHEHIRNAFQFVFPFVNSSMNWWTEIGWKLTPMGLASAIIKFRNLEQQIAKVEEARKAGKNVPATRMTEYLIRRDIGKGIVGTTFYVLGAILAAMAILRVDEEEEKIMLMIEDVKIDVSEIFGSSSILIGAALSQMWMKQADGEPMKFMDTIAMSIETLLDGFFVTDFMSRYRFSDGAFGMVSTFSEDALKSFVPQFIQFATSLTNNKKVRYSSGIKGGLQRYLNSWVPTQPFGDYVINVYTGEVESKYAIPVVSQFLQKGMLGPKIFWADISEEERMCREYRSNHGELTGEITVNDEKVLLNRHDLNVKYGQLNKAKLAKIKSQKHKVEMPNGKYKTLPWDQLSDEQKENVLNNVFKHNAQYAKIYTWTQSGHKYYASTSVYRELKELGITQNVYKGDKGFVE